MRQNNGKEDRFPDKKVIGITGGVGAGKSSVLTHILTHFDVSVLMADNVGAELMEPGKSVFIALIQAYGKEILKDNGEIDKKKLARIAFQDEESQKKINAVEHPLIKEEIERRIKEDPKKVIFLEAALLYEGGLVPSCDEVWYITANRRTRLKRLQKDRGYSLQKCRSIMKRQLSPREFKHFSDVVIKNNGKFERTAEKIDREMERILVK